MISIATLDLGEMTLERAAGVFSQAFLRLVSRRLSEGADAATILEEAAPLLSSIADCLTLIS